MTLDELTIQNKMLHAQLQELEDKKKVLQLLINDIDNDIERQLDDMESHKLFHSCTLCMGNCDQ